eukprot:gene5170-7016_t
MALNTTGNFADSGGNHHVVVEGVLWYLKRFIVTALVKEIEVRLAGEGRYRRPCKAIDSSLHLLSTVLRLLGEPVLEIEPLIICPTPPPFRTFVSNGLSQSTPFSKFSAHFGVLYAR